MCNARHERVPHLQIRLHIPHAAAPAAPDPNNNNNHSGGGLCMGKPPLMMSAATPCSPGWSAAAADPLAAQFCAGLFDTPLPDLGDGLDDFFQQVEQQEEQLEQRLPQNMNMTQLLNSPVRGVKRELDEPPPTAPAAVGLPSLDQLALPDLYQQAKRRPLFRDPPQAEFKPFGFAPTHPHSSFWGGISTG